MACVSRFSLTAVFTNSDGEAEVVWSLLTAEQRKTQHTLEERRESSRDDEKGVDTD